MDREIMVQAVVYDLEGWLKRDPTSFWDHVRELEYQYLRKLSDKELEDVYEESI